tara:strand:- start:53 stop:646 length:594 start_codon:yes stop_codon:yes gene_type:complete
MANQDAAFGLRPLKTVGQQDDSTGMSSYEIAAGDASVIYQGSLVGSPATGTGYVDLQTAGLLLNLGAFWGCFYNDPTTLKPTFKNYYPGSITPPNSGTVEAFVYDSPSQMYEIQSDNAAASAQADVFKCADLVGTSGSTLNGVSSMELDDGTLGTTGQFKIIGVSRDPENSDLSSANVNWRVMVNEHLLGSGSAGAA